MSIPRSGLNLLRVRCTRLALAAALAGCGGGGNDGGPNNVRTTAVKVAGDSLSDGGTFGAKATVQGASLVQTRLWVDVVTQSLGLAPLCPHYIDSGIGPVPNAALASVCTNHAVGGGVVNAPGGELLDDTPYAVPRQLEDMRKQAAFGPDELLLLDGGGNDAALVFGLFLEASQDNAQALLAVLADLLSAEQIAAARAGGEDAWAAAGSWYMTLLAERMADAIASQAIAFGAKRIVLLNMPDVSRTPRFTAALALVASLDGVEAAARRGAVASAWTRAYNDRLAQRLVGTREVAIVDFRALLDGWIANPSAAGFTNTAAPACPAVGSDSLGLPSYDLRTCTETLLSANPPPGASSADWWRGYLFSDHFHGTPLMNQKLADEALRVMAGKGWR